MYCAWSVVQLLAFFMVTQQSPALTKGQRFQTPERKIYSWLMDKDSSLNCPPFIFQGQKKRHSSAFSIAIFIYFLWLDRYLLQQQDICKATQHSFSNYLMLVWNLSLVILFLFFVNMFIQKSYGRTNCSSSVSWLLSFLFYLETTIVKIKNKGERGGEARKKGDDFNEGFQISYLSFWIYF